MSKPFGPFEINGIKVAMAEAPPVYAPGGPVALVFEAPDDSETELFSMIEAEVAERGGVLVVVQCTISSTSLETTLLANAYTYASSWYLGPLDQTNGEHPPVQVRTATTGDVARILEIGERKREQYEPFSPVFWKKAPTPRGEFAGYVTSQIESVDNIALVCEIDGALHGYIIAQCRNPTEGYVDDFAVADPISEWSSIGAPLLAEAKRRAAARDVASFSIVTAHADTPKRTMVESAGFTLRKNWLVKPVQAE